MEGPKVKNDSHKNQTEQHVKLVVNWLLGEEASPSFRKLMTLLLKPRDSNQAETARRGGENHEA